MNEKKSRILSGEKTKLGGKMKKLVSSVAFLTLSFTVLAAQPLENIKSKQTQTITAAEAVNHINSAKATGSLAFSQYFQFNTGNTEYCSAITLDASTFVVAYRDAGNSNYGTAVVGTVSGTTISYSAEYLFNSDATEYISATELSSTTFVVAYKAHDASSYGRAKLGGVDGALPVTLSSFTASYVNNSVVLEWITESLAGSLGFIIERRTGGIADWQQIASYLTDSHLVCMNNPIGQAQYCHTDDNIEANTQYSYRLSNANIFGNVSVLDVVEILATGVVGISQGVLPEKTALVASCPNPFNPQTTIAYQLPKDGKVTIRVYNLMGELVNGFKRAGYLAAVWDGKDFGNTDVNSGICLIKMQAGNYFAVKKATLLR